MPSDVPDLDEDDTLDLRGYIGVLRRRWKVIALCVIILLAAALGLSARQSKQYQARAEVLVRQQSADSVVAGQASSSDSFDAQRDLNNEVRVLESSTTVGAVQRRYHGPLDPGSVSATVNSSESDVIDVAVTAPNADAAAQLVNVYVDTYIAARRTQRVNELLKAGDEIQSSADAIDRQITRTRAPLARAEAALAAKPDDTNLRAQRDDLKQSVAADVATLQSKRSFYQQQLDDLKLTVGITQSGGAQVLTKAVAERTPVSPKPARNAAVAVLLGLILGVGIAFLRENLDERIRGGTDLHRATGGLPTLALVAHLDGKAAAKPSFVVSRDDSRAHAAESYRSLRTAVKFASLDKEINVLQVTSAVTGEGKTTTIANLAVTLAQGGDRVAVVCCDLRKPRVHERFLQTLTPGFTDVLVGDIQLSSALRRYDDKIYVLPAGTPPPNPSELLSTDRAAEVVALLAKDFDMVLLDTPPVLPVTDALVVSRLVDATIVVVDGRQTKRKALKRTLQLLTQVNAPVLGVVLNGAPPGGGYGYGYGYGYDTSEGYGDSGGTKWWAPWSRNGHDSTPVNGHSQPLDDRETEREPAPHEVKEPASPGL